MAGDGVNVPLLLRTAQTLRERFADLRSLGPVLAVMEEIPRGASVPKDSGPSTGGVRKLPFRAGLGPTPQWRGGSVIERDGQPAASRSLWLGANDATYSRLMRLCRDANGFVPFARRTHGLSLDCGTTDAKSRWIWTVFELAESRPPFTVLALDGPGDVFRCDESGCTTTESCIETAETGDRDGDPIAELLYHLVRRGKFHPQRYWQLDDFVEASIAVMDLIEVAIPSLAQETEEEPPPGPEGGDEGPEDTTKAKRGRPHKRTIMGGLEEAVAAAYAADPDRQHWTSSQLATVVPFGESTIRTRCKLFKRTRKAVKAEAADKAKQAEAELASRRAEDNEGHDLHRSSSKSRVGRQRTTAEERELHREGSRLIAEAERAQKRPK
jgi:hypothetical protein